MTTPLESWHSYPKIYGLGHAGIAELFLDPVVVQEKIDGSQFSFGKFGSELRIKSKDAIIQPEQPPKMFKRAVDYVISVQDKLTPNWTYRGEVLDKPKHNTLNYARVPANNIILFDINIGYEHYLEHDAIREAASYLGLEVVPLLTCGLIKSWEELKPFMEFQSILGGTKVEGIVIKNYNRFGVDKNVLMGKFVSEAFKESHNREWKAGNPGQRDIIEQLILTLKTEARWQKAIAHLREQDLITDSPKDIGPLIAEIRNDIEKEETEFIKGKLFEWAQGQLGRGFIRGFPEWYKEQLAQKQNFGGEKGGNNNN